MARKPTGAFGNLANEFEDARSDYSMAKSSRFRKQRTGVSRQGRPGDWHTRVYGDRLLMMELARDMDRNDTVVGQCITRATENIVQDGMGLDPQTGDPRLDADLRQRWDNWANDPDQCDLAGEMTFNQMEELAVRCPIVDGDMFFLPTKSGALEAIESHRCRTPTDVVGDFKVVDGVKLSPERKRLEYWFTANDVDPFKSATLMGDVTKYGARDKDGNRQVFHVYDPKRFSQTRGITALAPIVDVCGMFEDINFAKLVQQQIAGCFAIIRNRNSVFGRGPSTPLTGEASTQPLADGTTRQLEGISPGMEILGNPGETISGFTPTIANSDFTQHIRLMLQLIGINLGLPLVMVLMDASETNFSGWRGAIDEARRHFRRNQKHLISKFHREVYLWQVRRWMASDRSLRSAAKRVDIFEHRWNRPSWPYIEPLKDAQADLLMVRNGLTSPRRLHAARGHEWRDIQAEIVQDNTLAISTAIAAAIKINSGVPSDMKVHWRELLSLPTPDGVKVKLGDESGDGATATKESQ